MAATEAEVAARLIERLLADPAFRARFRRDPAAACREAGLEDLAQEMSLGAGKAMYTLDVRESKSSLAGVMMAAAMEGVGIYEFSAHVLPHLEEIPGQVSDVLSRVNLPAIGGGGGGHGGGAALADAAGGGGGGGAAESALPDAASAGPATTEATGSGAGAAAPGGAAGAGVASAGAPRGAATPSAAADQATGSRGTGAAADAATSRGGGGALHHVNPAQYGAEGTGGAPDPEAVALLHNKNIVLDANGMADIKAGRIDPRVVAVLTKLSHEHKLVISCTCSDHPKFTSGGSISNHHFGRGVDIASVDGQIVNAGNPIARDIAGELSGLDPAYRPNEIGSPWAIAGPGYFTDAAHQNHLHIGFKQAITPDWKPPADVAAPGDGGTTAAAPDAAATGNGAAAAAAPPEAATAAATAGPATAGAAPPEAAAAAAPAAPAAAAAAPAAAAAAAAPPAPGHQDSLLFKAVTAKDASARVRSADSLAFLKAADQPRAQAAAAPGVSPSGDAVAQAAEFAGGPDAYPGDNAPRDQIAAWMAAQAQKRGLPPELPVMASLVESGMKNLNYGDADSVGFYQMRVGIWNQGAYAGFPDKPELQVKWFLDQAEAVKKQRLAQGKSITDPNQYGDWIADVERPAEQYRGRYQLRLSEAQGLLKTFKAHDAGAPAAAPGAAATAPPQAAAAGAPAAGAVVDAGAVPSGGAGGSPLGAAALRIAHTQRGVHEIGSTNTGAQVDQYLAAAGVPPGNPWCASFVTWSLQQAGHKMQGGGWGGVATWVRNAEQGSNGLKFVSPEDARPGDIVAYDWGGQNDFGADGHIGFLASNVNGSQFTALEGNNADAVNVVPRHLGGANIKFIRIEGNAPAGTGAAPGGASAAAGAPVASAASAGPAPPAAAPGGPAAAAAAAPPAPGHQDSLTFRAVTAQEARKPRAATLQFKAVDPPQAQASQAPAAAPPEAAAPGVSPSGDAVAQAAQFAGGPDAYPGDNAPRDQIAAWMAAQAQKRGLPPELPVMASLVESGMKNLNYGDADSVGFYQMRVGIWNQGAYAGFPDKPELQVKWFLDQAEAVKKQRLAQGKSITDPNQYGDWIADVERPAEQYRGRYQLRLSEAQGLLKTFKAHDAGAPAAAPGAAATAPPQAAAAGAPGGVAAAAPPEAVAPGAAAAAADGSGPKLTGAVADAVAKAVAEGNGPGPKALIAIHEAEKYVGTPYHWGGSTPQTGFDCSGLMQWSYAQAGIKLPRVSEQQILAGNGTPIDREHLRPGDLVFFDESGDVGHVGMYIGNDEILHAPHTGDVVKVASLDDPWFVQHFAGGRRFDMDAPAAAAAAPGAPVAVAAAAPGAPAAPPVDPAAVASAHAAVARDAAEVRRHDSLLFAAVKAQEARKQRMTVQFMKAIDPSQVKRAAAAASPAPVASAAAAPPEAAPAAAPAGAAVQSAAAAPPEAAAAQPAAAQPAAAAPPEAASVGPAVDVAGAATDYPGNNASQAELAKWLAAQAQKAGLPPELPVMASLVESGVKNLNYGDADSVGFFQMRVGIWNKGPYAGFPEKPELQVKWFIDQALAVKRKAIASGNPDFGRDPSHYGDWIADIERPLEAYRGRYQLRLGQARNLLSS